MRRAERRSGGASCPDVKFGESIRRIAWGESLFPPKPSFISSLFRPENPVKCRGCREFRKRVGLTPKPVTFGGEILEEKEAIDRKKNASGGLDRPQLLIEGRVGVVGPTRERSLLNRGQRRASWRVYEAVQ